MSLGNKKNQKEPNQTSTRAEEEPTYNFICKNREKVSIEQEHYCDVNTRPKFRSLLSNTSFRNFKLIKTINERKS